MLILPVDEARPGMTLAAPVRSAESPDQDLLKRGYVLEDTVIRRMREIGISQVFVTYPALDDLDRHLEPFMSPARQQMFSQIKTTFAQSQSHMHPQVPYQDYYTSIRELVVSLMSQGRHPIYLDQMARLGGDAVTHAAGVAHLALMLGIKLERYLLEQRKRLSPAHAKEVVNLGVAGMVHDIGKLQLPKHLQQLHGLSEIENEADRKEFENHPRMAYDLIHEGCEPSGASAVLHHHQHFDGSGFAALVNNDGTTRTMGGNTVHVFARILQAADLYDRLAVAPGVNQRRSNLEILHDMRTRYAGWTDPVVLNALHEIAPPFPPGTRLTLGDGSVAIVTNVNPSDPFHPTVKQMGEEFGSLKEPAIDLSQPGSPTIAKIGTMDVSRFLPEAVA
jgi:HD-GYP domain-containing protein (c-di-GMP phosphodiesterase class II)